MITTWYISHLDMLFSIMQDLLNHDKWFDVRCLVSAEKWSITFNDEYKVPAKLARFLEKPVLDHHPSRHEPLAPQPKKGRDVVAAAKAQRAKQRKGTRR
jgi:hypothetical protein